MQFFLRLCPSNCVSVLTLRKCDKQKKRLCFPWCVRLYMFGGMFRIHAGDFTCLTWEREKKCPGMRLTLNAWELTTLVYKSILMSSVPKVMTSEDLILADERRRIVWKSRGIKNTCVAIKNLSFVSFSGQHRWTFMNEYYFYMNTKSTVSTWILSKYLHEY